MVMFDIDNDVYSKLKKIYIRQNKTMFPSLKNFINYLLLMDVKRFNKLKDVNKMMEGDKEWQKMNK